MINLELLLALSALGNAGGLALVLHDAMKLRDRVDAIEVEDTWFTQEEAKLESQDDQLRSEVDELRQAVDFLRRAQRPRADMLQTLVGGFAPPIWDPEATSVRSPNTPRLPRFEEDE